MCAASKRRVYPFDMTEVPPDGYVLKWSKVLGGFWCYEPFGHNGHKFDRKNQRGFLLFLYVYEITATSGGDVGSYAGFE